MLRKSHLCRSFQQYKKRQAIEEASQEPIPSLPSTYSVHDFHNFGIYSSGIAPGLHFHLATSINAETDIPLVPSISGPSELNFVIHWLDNKEMTFTQEAEKLLSEMSQKIFHGSESSEHVAEGVADKAATKGGTKAHEEDTHSKQSISTGSSSASLATDMSNQNMEAMASDLIEKKWDVLIRDWRRTPDLLFSIHPVDGSFLVCIST
ncbi:DMXL1 [Cordylochernes scorpioides]|uniref:DMXL1 n=1 Tax=Cordylochernes scorpioides TaxID=51811 RepID=A0ABY6KTS3_9ARAC|nr:DMXL1 [Cordylochernes scorpioides]